MDDRIVLIVGMRLSKADADYIVNLAKAKLGEDILTFVYYSENPHIDFFRVKEMQPISEIEFAAKIKKLFKIQHI